MKVFRNEAALEAYCVRLARKHGYFAIKLYAITQRGLPDRLFVRHGQHVFVEFKHNDKNARVRPQQKYTIDVLRKCGAVVHVINNDRDFCKLMLPELKCDA